MKKIQIDELAAGGDGVGRDDEGRVTFVANTAVGDVVEVDVFEEKRSFARAKLLEVVEPGPGRREPTCQHAGLCGGCQWLH